jgi:pyruvate kinase
MRLTKIVCTIGPSCNTEKDLRALVKSGMNFARLNLTHASAQKQLPIIHSLKKIRSSTSQGFGILLDVRCAQVRTSVVSTPIKIIKGSNVYFGVETLRSKHRRSETYIGVDYSAFAKDILNAEMLLIDNGEMSFDILSVSSQGIVHTRALQDGCIGSRRHVNLPGADISLPTFTEADWKDIACATKEGVDYLALSFVRNAEDIFEVRRYLEKRRSPIRIMAKIETRQAVANLQEIIDASDSVMVARGDLGAEVPFEEVPYIQDTIVRACRRVGKPVVIATHMLESMMFHPLPTRAEATDVAHAANTLVDSTVLSGETASGKHPIIALEAMHRILIATEKHLHAESFEEFVEVHGAIEARSQAAVQLARSLQAEAIVVMTRSGRSAQALSKFRSQVPVIAITENPHVWAMLSLHYGVMPILSSFKGELEECAVRGIRRAKTLGLLRKKMKIVLVSGTEITGGSVISVQEREVG